MKKKHHNALELTPNENALVLEVAHAFSASVKLEVERILDGRSERHWYVLNLLPSLVRSGKLAHYVATGVAHEAVLASMIRCARGGQKNQGLFKFDRAISAEEMDSVLRLLGVSNA